MKTSDFYKIIDTELLNIISKNRSTDENIKKHSSSIDNQKSYAFMLWFLNNYYNSADTYDFVKESITDGDEDFSCDIIFNKHYKGENIFFVVQSKWHKETNFNSSSGTASEIKKCLNDFELILSGKDLPSRNASFNKKYDELKKHKQTNGKIKFIYLSLSVVDQPRSNIEGFKQRSKLIDLIVYDILDLKRDFIDARYKKLIKENPFEEKYTPQEKITIEFIKDKVIEVSSPYKSLIMLVRPKFIHDLFDKYKFSLFAHNVRNPLFKSEFNRIIEKTMKDEAVNFWYFNNGVTAITPMPIPDYYNDSGKLDVNGIQIINGAQTVYSIYTAYEEATTTKRDELDNNALISIRLLQSGGKPFDLKVTRFTNSQNPVDDRDFYSNDEYQLKAQKYFLNNSEIWYEKRRGEFRYKPNKRLYQINVTPNIVVAKAYLAFHLQEPQRALNETKYIFISATLNKSGLYETIFNENTTFPIMLISYYIYEMIDKKRKLFVSEYKKAQRNKIKTTEDNRILQKKYRLYSDYYILALFKVLLYQEMRNEKQIVSKIIADHNSNDTPLMNKYYSLIVKKLDRYFENKCRKDPTFEPYKYFKLLGSYNEIRDFVKSRK